MKYLLSLLFGLGLTFNVNADEQQCIDSPSTVSFEYESTKVPLRVKQIFECVVAIAERDVRSFFPTMTKKINFKIKFVDWDLSTVGGVSGMAKRHAPVAEIVVIFSSKDISNLSAVIQTGLRATLIHELHHIARGWAIEDNMFGQGIHIAATNEGLAVVFSELLTGYSQDANQGPPEIESWVEDIMLLPLNANYQHWVSNKHPDGRMSIGYKAGRHIVYKALSLGGKNIIELSQLPVDRILSISGYQYLGDATYKDK